MRKSISGGYARFIANLVVGFLLIVGNQVCRAGDGTATAPLAQGDSSFPEDSLNDGPHVYWQTDSSAIVFYLCSGAVIKHSFICIDTLRFHGFCQDSGVEYTIPLKSPAVKPHIFNNASRIIAISDVHGEYGHLIDVLVDGGVIDDQHRWVWGDAHLVVVGDVFDRGDEVTECLWFIYRLELEAERNGGRVHFILGNHELMILRGDNRYVHGRYLNGIVRRTGIEHEDLYGPDMELGKWLRSKHTMVKINDIIFVHAGISPFLIDRDLDLRNINETVRNNIDLRSSRLAFNEPIKLLFGGKGPFWYRGYHYEMEESYPRASQGVVDSILTYYDADAIVIGHTEVSQVSAFYEGRVIAVDVPVEDLGCLQALLWQYGKFYRVTEQGELQPIE
jgi:hypothetical protein